MDINWTYCGYLFTVYENQAIMLYTLNLNSAICNFIFVKLDPKKEKCRSC